MKIGNLLGTLKNTFSMGKGVNLASFRTNGGVLEGQHNGWSWKRLATTKAIHVSSLAEFSLATATQTTPLVIIVDFPIIESGLNTMVFKDDTFIFGAPIDLNLANSITHPAFTIDNGTGKVVKFYNDVSIGVSGAGSVVTSAINGGDATFKFRNLEIDGKIFEAWSSTAIIYEKLSLVNSGSIGINGTGTQAQGIWDNTAGNGESAEKTITQTSHGFSIRMPIYHDGVKWVQANALDVITADAQGIVSEIVDANTFKITIMGFIDWTGGVGSAGSYLYVSETTGALTTNEPSISKAMVQVLDNNVALVLHYRGIVVSSELAKMPVLSISANTTLTYSQKYIRVDASGGSVTITLPSAVGHAGYSYEIKKIDDTSNEIIIDGNGTEKIDGDLTAIIGSLGGRDAVRIVSNGVDWDIGA